jgi:SpoIID/LytB domain protein
VRRSLASVLAALVLAPVAAASVAGPSGDAPIAPGPTARWFVAGHGWGHGVGMSQYGASGFAQHGWTFQRILAWYYRGTTLALTPARRVRVLLAQGRSSLTISSPVDFRLIDGTGKSHPLAAGSYSFGPTLALKIDVAQKPRALPGPLTFAPGSQPLVLGKPYRGQIQASAVGGRLQAIDLVGLEQYLYGVVPSEMPSAWTPEALKAQAVAARSYALAHLRSGAFDLYSDTRSQVYGGVSAEKPSTNAAVDATAGQIVTWAGKPANTVFFSTSGGRTMSALDAWGGDVPYLVSVADPYDTLSPYHDWGPYGYSSARLDQLLRVPGRLLDVTTTRNSSGRAASVVGTGSEGAVTVPATKLRIALGLRSTWFDVGVLSLAPPQGGAVVYGGTGVLSGVERGLEAAVLEQRPATGTAWSAAGGVKPAKDGTFTVSVKPKVTTSYRLAAGKVKGAGVMVPVAPLVRFARVTSAEQLNGSVRPALPGAKVEIQRSKDDATWSKVATAKVAADGTFSAGLLLVPGSYRARVAPSGGYVAGTSKVLRVVGA